MRLRESLLAFVAGFRCGPDCVFLSVISSSVRPPDMSQAACCSKVYIRALREYYQWLNVIRDRPPVARTLLSPYLDTGPAQAGRLAAAVQPAGAGCPIFRVPAAVTVCRCPLCPATAVWDQSFAVRPRSAGLAGTAWTAIWGLRPPAGRRCGISSNQRFCPGRVSLNPEPSDWFPDFLFPELTLVAG